MTRLEIAAIAAAVYLAFVLQAGGARCGLPELATASLLIAASAGFAITARPVVAMTAAIAAGLLDDALAAGVCGPATALLPGVAWLILCCRSSPETASGRRSPSFWGSASAALAACAAAALALGFIRWAVASHAWLGSPAADKAAGDGLAAMSTPPFDGEWLALSGLIAGCYASLPSLFLALRNRSSDPAAAALMNRWRMLSEP